ncbi:MAG: SRPBCC family protein [Candidatus Omnitrophica bacterium]|nr:SRPBCC family protein [Candidatus Omnitrophota bacterium]
MAKEEVMKIRLSKVVPAPEWKVIRLITKVEDFPSYMVHVKEASVVEKSRNKMKTKWRVEVNNVPISWVEEDTLDLRNNTVRFNAVEGDLEEFKGEWIFKKHPEGTEVIVNVQIRVGIPVIADFADDFIKKLVTSNFEAILDAMERRLISLRYASFKHGDKDKVAGFGIIGHPYNYNHWQKYLQALKPDIKMPSREFLGQLFNVAPSFKLYDIMNVKSNAGAVTNGCFIIATFIPDMIEKDMWSIFAKVVRACRIAEKYGVGIVTLGGFTSIVAERIGQEIANEVDVAVTTGNTFTAAMAVEGVLKASRMLDLDISAAKATVIGGTGDIGSACARVLSEKAAQVTITGRTKSNLAKMKKELSKKRKARIAATTDNEAAVRDADIVIAAAAASASILKIEWFKPGAIICDVGYPKNISYAPVSRQDVLIFSGGMAKAPTPIHIPIDIGLPPGNVLYGCFSEAIILALEKRYENFSFGRGNITSEKMEEIRLLGAKHGFEVSDFYWGDKLVDASMVGRVKETIKV